jgi:YbbR domain-containing protein
LLERIYRDYIRKNGKLKILSLILAGMLWFAVSFMGESKMSLSVRVSTENLERDLMVTKLQSDEVLVTVSGPVSILKQIRGRDVKVAVNLSGLRAGRFVFNLEKKDIQVPQGMHVDEVKPDYVEVQVDRTIEKRLRTVVKLDDKVAAMYKVKSWYPRYVTVEGPKAFLDTLNEMETLPVTGDYHHEEEETYTGLNTKGMVLRSVRPDQIRVVVRR